ncbi:hypothetical protein STEG23_027874 [Scotinomys teguina]
MEAVTVPGPPAGLWTWERKPGTGDYRLVQDLREVNSRAMDIHPTVPNPYNLLSTLSPDRQWYTVLDLKDAFFCLRLHESSQSIFAFEWTDPEAGFSGQLTWTRLPQGFKNSPTIFDEALHQDLGPFRAANAPRRWLTNARITHYQSVLLDKDRITFGPPTAINPATLLPEEHGEEVIHKCQDILAEEAGVRSDLKDTPLPHSDVIWYTDRSSFLHEGNRRAGAAVVDKEKVIWSARLPEGTSAQKAELIALTKALEEARGRRATIHTDSRYAFATAHVHGAIYRERGLLTSAGKEIKNKEEILALLAAVMLPQELAIVHCPGHQKRDNPVAKGNRRADEEARAAAMREELAPKALVSRQPQDPFRVEPTSESTSEPMPAEKVPEYLR